MRGWAIALMVLTGSPAYAGENWPCVSRKALDPKFLEVSEVTGGQVLLLEPGEVGKAGFAAVQRQFHPETVFRAFGELQNEVREFPIPVDTSIESLLISASVECNGGIHIKTSQRIDAEGQGREFRQSRVLKVLNPVPGTWRLRVTGRGRFYVIVEAKTWITLDRAALADQVEGLPGGQRAPKLGSDELWRLDVSGPAARVRFRLIAGDGRTLALLDEKPAEMNQTFLRAFPIEHERFRISVEGVDDRGYPFQRMTRKMVLASRN